MTVVLKVAGGDSNDSVYRMSEVAMTTNDAKYHAVRLTRHDNNLTLTVDNPHQRHLTGRHGQLVSISAQTGMYR